MWDVCGVAQKAVFHLLVVCVCSWWDSGAEGHFTVETLRLDVKALISRLGEKDIQGTL